MTLKNLLAGALLLGSTMTTTLTTTMNMAAASASAQELAHWSPEAASTLNAVVVRHANKGAFAVFDMDNTLYRYDLEESLLPFLEIWSRLPRIDDREPAVLKISYISGCQRSAT